MQLKNNNNKNNSYSHSILARSTKLKHKYKKLTVVLKHFVNKKNYTFPTNALLLFFFVVSNNSHIFARS